MKMKAAQTLTAVLCAVSALLLATTAACAFKPESDEYKALKEAYRADPGNPDILESLMVSELLERDNTKKAIALYGANADILSGRVMARVYYATALCRMAGESRSPSKQLKYVREGLHEFEALTDAWPDDGRVYLWQAITYSNFPEMLGADQLVTDAIALANRKIDSGEWTFVEAELRQLVYAYANLAQEFKSPAYLDAAREQAARTGLQNDEQAQAAIASASKRMK